MASTLHDSADARPALIDASFSKPLLLTAARAVLDLWDSTRQTFWRSTEHRKRDQANAPSTAFFPTVSFSSLDGLLRLVMEHPELVAASDRDVILSQCVPRVLTLSPTEIESSLVPESGHLNTFSRSLHLSLLARMAALAVEHGLAEQSERINDVIHDVRVELVTQLMAAFDGENSGFAKHPFVLFHAVRALDSCGKWASTVAATDVGETDLIAASRTHVLEAIEIVLSRSEVSVLSPTDSVALAFCGAALALYGNPDDRPYIVAALNAAFRVQDASGAWPLGRVVAEGKDIHGYRLEMPTYEVAWIIAETLAILAKRYGQDLGETPVDSFVAKLMMAARYAERSAAHMRVAEGPRRGWCSDHPYGRPMIESWTSAAVLQSILALLTVAREANTQSVLRTFMVTDPRSGSWPPWLRWEDFRTESEPDSARAILAYLDRHIVKPIHESPRHLPDPQRESVSFVLFGPPGTSKTTIVKAIAEGLGWPLVHLTPGDFIARGLEYIEAQARSIFSRLLELQRVVILFDECDELFRVRRPSEESEQIRGITAFVTASMLPKLQDLHDQGTVVFAIATNLIESLDPAVRRSGRIDHVIGVGPPDRPSRLKILTTATNTIPERPFLHAAVDELASSSDRFTRKELVRSLRRLAQSAEWRNEDDARESARRIAEATRSALAIDQVEMQAFREQQAKYSRPFLQGEQHV